MTNGVFSDFELDQFGIKFDGENEYQSMNCVGALEEELNSRVITKKCRGVVFKKIVKGAGDGKIKVTAHIPWEIYTEMYGMNLDNLFDGVKAYGKNSVHKGFGAVAHVKDEDGEEKYKAYPNCVVETGVVRKIENGAEEVAELEFEASTMPDEYGNCMYEALASELNESVAEEWMTSFNPTKVNLSTGSGNSGIG